MLTMSSVNVLLWVFLKPCLCQGRATAGYSTDSLYSPFGFIGSCLEPELSVGSGLSLRADLALSASTRTE